jgi:hypothetical protein
MLPTLIDIVRAPTAGGERHQLMDLMLAETRPLPSMMNNFRRILSEMEHHGVEPYWAMTKTVIYFCF